MGSLRNPVGPLPSSIYWRRRVVLLSVFALLALLTLWVVTSGGGGKKNGADGGGGKNPASSITPGPSGSGPAISQNPGGRDESGDGTSSGSGSGSGSGSDGGAGSGGSDGGSGAGGLDDGANGSGSGGEDGGGTGTTLPAGTTLPDCTPGSVTLTLLSVQNAYSPDQTPTFRLTAKNASGSDCKVDLGPRTAVLTITQAGGADAYWSSADCPKTAGSLLYRVPAGDSFTYTLKWNRKPSAPECATPPAGTAGAGTYLVEAKAPGFAKAQTSFVLKDD
ncbi:hypothetical protein J2X68_003358 [Streptomyces sp. 3330]|uniref:hypothetical protein n=1 Tax=Streptomyces sp. 3330 TaxID=2817755 RepID=UPI00285F4D07|nr:hypothetical protein [Streptomyces sp. 3330]MDR6976667.1 hypothetical protein [Streptomyces sp. 3330]